MTLSKLDIIQVGKYSWREKDEQSLNFIENISHIIFFIVFNDPRRFFIFWYRDEKHGIWCVESTFPCTRIDLDVSIEECTQSNFDPTFDVSFFPLFYYYNKPSASTFLTYSHFCWKTRRRFAYLWNQLHPHTAIIVLSKKLIFSGVSHLRWNIGEIHISSSRERALYIFKISTVLCLFFPSVIRS